MGDTTIPLEFCIKDTLFNLHNPQIIDDGYYLIQAELIEGTQSFRLRFKNVNNNQYRLERYVGYTTDSHPIKLVKPTGVLEYTCRWKYKEERLKLDENYYPVLDIVPRAFLKTGGIKNRNGWIRMAQPSRSIPLIKISMCEIPFHVINALLRDAMNRGEICPITNEDLTPENGAVTTCFHLFEKNAIATWLLTPNSNQLCPVCKKQCKCYSV
jgi:hypothetical protein